MTLSVAYVFALLAVAMALFVWDFFPVDVVGLVILVLLVVPGIVPAPEALASFGDPTIIVLISLFVLTTGVVRTGVVERIGLRLAAFGGKNPKRLIRLTLPIVTGLGVALSNTERTAIFLPVIVGFARKAAIPLSRVLMPLAFAALLGGGLTVISTSTNLLVSSQLPRYGMKPIGFFEPFPVGICLALCGLAYVLFVAPKLLPDRSDEDLTGRYDLRRYLSEAVLTPGSRLAGKTLSESQLGAAMNLNVLGLVRDDRKQLAPRPQTVLREGDILIVEGRAEDILSVKDTQGLEIQPERKLSDPDLQSEEVRMMEAMVLPTSDLVGRTLGDSGFRERTGVTVLAVHSAGGRNQVEKISRRRLKASDVLLLQGHSEDLGRIRSDGELLLLEDVSAHHPRTRRGRFAAAIFVGSILLGASGALALPVAFLLGGLLLVLTRCITTQEAYEAVPWRLIVMIACMITFGVAMERTGAARQLATWIVPWLRPLGPRGVLAGFFALTVFLTQPMSNQAAALVVLPVAISVCRQLGLNPRTFVMGVTFAASCSFLTPLEPSCVLVYGPGRYRFFDFTKVGAPLTVLVFILAIILIPIFWPFQSAPGRIPETTGRPAPAAVTPPGSVRGPVSETIPKGVGRRRGDGESSASRLPLFARGVLVPAAREPRPKPPHTREIRRLAEEPGEHSGELSKLDVLEPQLASEPFALTLLRVGREPGAARDREEELFFGARVLPQRPLENIRRPRRAGEVSRRQSGDRRTEELVQPAVRGVEDSGERVLARAQRLAAATLFVPIAFPSTGSSTAASGSPTSMP